MKRIRNILMLLALSVGVVSCGSQAADPSENATDSTVTQKVKTVKTLALQKVTVAETVEYSANLQAWEENNFASSNPGRINKIYVEVGDYVGKGQLIVEMDKTQLNNSRIQLLSAKRELDRLDTLLAIGGVSKQVYDNTKMQYDLAKEGMNFLEENTLLKAPFSGIVTGKYFENGELYSGAPNTQAGKAAIVTIMQINPLKASVNMSEKFYTKVKKGMTANLSCELFPEQEFAGKIHNVYPTIDPISRTFTIEVSVPNPGTKLRPGMFSRIEFDLGEMEAFVIPSIAVLKQPGTNERYVFIEENGKAKRVAVTLGKRYNDKVEIISDEVKKGDKLIVSGQSTLIKGQPVSVKN